MSQGEQALPGPERFRTLVHSQNRSVVIHDVDADAWINDPTGGPGAASDGYRIGFSTRQDLSAVAVEITIWDAEPPATSPDPSWDGERRGLFHAETGQIAVEGVFVSGAPDSFTLPAPATYHVRMRWRGRSDADGRTQDVVQQAVDEDWEPPRLDTALRALDGTEQYHLDLWPSDDALPDEDEDEDDEAT
jgi:hypothetical protein